MTTSEIHVRTWAIDNTDASDAEWIATAVAPVGGVAVFEDGRVVIDETAFYFLCDLDADTQDGAVEQVSGGLAMYAAGDAYPVREVSPRGIDFGKV